MTKTMTAENMAALLTPEQRHHVPPTYLIGQRVFAIIEGTTESYILCPACPNAQGWILGRDGNKYSCAPCRGLGSRRVRVASIEERIVGRLSYYDTDWSYSLLRPDFLVEVNKYREKDAPLDPVHDLSCARHDDNESTFPQDEALIGATREEAEAKLVVYNEKLVEEQVTWKTWEKV